MKLKGIGDSHMAVIVDLNKYKNKLFIKLIDSPPTAQQQTKLLSDAIKAKMSKGTYVTVEQVEDRYVKITGDIQATQDEIGISQVVGRASEVLINDAVNDFLDTSQMRQRYGFNIIEGTARVLIPIDFNKQGKTTSQLHKYFNSKERKLLRIAKQEWTKLEAGKSVGDFVMAGAYPVESKGKIKSYVFLNEGGANRYKPSTPSFGAFKNEYIKAIAHKGGKVIVGATAFDAVFTNVLGKVADELNRDWANMSSKSMTKKEGRFMMYDLQLSQANKDAVRKGELFKLVGLKINMFVPLALDKNNFEEYLTSTVIEPSDHKAVAATQDFTQKMVERLITRYFN